MNNDILYTIVMILFTLSLIAERLSNIFKLSLDGMQVKSYDKRTEKCRELKIMLTALGFGWLVALIAGADLFGLLRGEGLAPLFGDHLDAAGKPIPGSGDVQYGFGIFLSGIFISLGSKFWHDMLDIVLQFASLKKFQADQAAANAQTAETNALDARMRLIEPELKKMNGYSGYDFDAGGRRINLKFKSGNQPTKQDQSSITDALGAEKFQIISTDIKP